MRYMPYIDALIAGFCTSCDEQSAADQAIVFDASLEKSGWAIVPAAKIESDAKVIAALREALDRHDRWLAKAADTLNISARMSDMDLGSEITKYRRKFLAANEQAVAI